MMGFRIPVLALLAAVSSISGHGAVAAEAHPESALVLPPPKGVVLWPAGARVEQMLILRRDELDRALKDHPEVKGVKRVLVVDYVIPGPPAPPSQILDFYATSLSQPEWKPVFLCGGTEPRIAYKGDCGFVSILPRSRGATVVYTEGDVKPSDVPVVDRAVRAVVEQCEKVPAEAKDHIGVALDLRRQGKTAEAASQLRAVAAQYPSADTAQFYLATVLAEQRQFAEAGRHFRRAIVLSPSNAKFRVAYAEYLIGRGDFGGAQYELGQGAALDPGASGAQEGYLCLGAALERQGRKPEAIDAYRNALTLSPGYKPACDALDRLAK
jgi:TolA-binding protein